MTVPRGVGLDYPDPSFLPDSPRGADRFFELLWGIFVLTWFTSFFWWGRITVGRMQIPLMMAALVPIAVAAAYAWRSGKLPGAGTRVVRAGGFALGFMVLAVGFSANVAKDPGVAMGVVAEAVVYVAIYVLIVSTLSSWQSARRMVPWLAAVACALAIQALYQYATGAAWRANPGNVNPATNTGAYLFSVAILLMLGRLLFGARRTVPVVLWGVMLILLVVALVLSYSRGAWLATIVGVMVLAARSRGWRPHLVLLGMVAVPLLFAPVRDRVKVALSPDQQQVTIRDFFGEPPLIMSNTTPLRLRNFNQTLESIGDSPLIGQGAGKYHGRGKGDRAPHNAYLRLWSESGIVALGGFLVFLSLVWRRVHEAARHGREHKNWVAPACEAVLIAQLSYLFLGDWIYQVYFWVIVGIVAVAADRPGPLRGRRVGATS